MSHPTIGRGPDQVPRRFLVPFALLLGASLFPSGRAPAVPFKEDPVEVFRQVLKTDEAKRFPRTRKASKALDFAEAYRRKKLIEAEKGLETIGDLSKALLLVEWPSRVPRQALARAGSIEGYVRDYLSPYEQRMRRIENEVRDRMVKSFNDKVKEVLNSPDSRPAAQVAVCNLVGDMASGAEEVDDVDLSLYARLAPLADDLRKLALRTENPEVRAAVAGTLGRFPKSPKIATQTLEDMLKGKGRTEAERRAAAAGLVSLVQAVTGAEPLRASEPGVGRREVPRGLTRRFEVGYRRDLLNVVTHVVPVAASGLQDPAPRVREECASALERAASALLVELSIELQIYRDNDELPSGDKERTWDEDERQRVLEYHEQLKELLGQYRPAIEAFAGTGAALAQAAVDRDDGVRLEIRRAIQHLARIRRALQELRSSIPPSREKGAAPKKAAAPREKARVVPTSGTSATIPLPHLPILRLPPPPASASKSEELIDRLLDKVGDSLRRAGFTDPDPRGRRAAMEAVEASAELAQRYLPEVVRALDDRDVFVRWIAARTLNKAAAAAEPGKAPAASLAIPALIRRLGDEDLDPRIAAARALGAYGAQAEAAIPALTVGVEKGDVEYRIAAMKALESIGTASASALPALARSFNHIDPRIRAEAVRVIGRFGTAPQTRDLARRYLPDLRRLTTDRDADVRRAASAAIVEIARGAE